MNQNQEHELKRRIMAREISREDAIKEFISLGVPDSIAATRVAVLRDELEWWEHPDPSAPWPSASKLDPPSR